jgi:hypothetical protein
MSGARLKKPQKFRLSQAASAAIDGNVRGMQGLDSGRRFTFANRARK